MDYLVSKKGKNDVFDKQADMYNLGDDQFKIDLKHFHLRFILWFANYMNIPSQLCNIGDTAVNGKSPIVMGTPTICHEGTTKLHLHIANATIIFGGHNDSALPNTPQILHEDFGYMKVAGGEEYSISENANLSDKQCPGSVIIPIQDYRELCFAKGTVIDNVRVEKGDEALFFLGDVSHGGQTHTLDKNNLSYHPSIHLYIKSDLHTADVEDFNIDTNGIANNYPQLLPMLKVPEQLIGVDEIGTRFVNAATQGMRNQGGTTQMATLIGKHVVALLKALNEEQREIVLSQMQSNKRKK